MDDEVTRLTKAQLRVGNAYTREYLRQVKQKLEIESDYALAKRLQVSKSAISNYQNGSTAFSDAVCQRVAEILEINPAMVVSFIEVDRHSGASMKELETRTWIAKVVMQATKQAGAVHSLLLAFLVALGFITTPPNAYAVVTSPAADDGAVCILCKVVRALFRRLIRRRWAKLKGLNSGTRNVQSAWSIAPAVAIA